MRRTTVGLLIIAACAFAMIYPAAAQESGQATHTVQAGENLFRIALRYGVTVDAIMAANGLGSPNLIYVGQTLVIPAGGSASTPIQSEPAPTATGGATHTIARGETLFSVARQYGVTINAIMQTNGISDPNRIYAGQTLTIPTSNSTAPEPAAAPANTGSVAGAQHTVGRGETLGSIAQRYGVPVGDILSANGISDPNRIYAGQTLTIPGVAAALPQERVYLDVPVVQQSRNLSCESASACSLLRYMGYGCDNDMVVFNNLPRSYDNPHRGFVGSVDIPAGSLPPGAASSNVGGYGIYVEALSYGLRSMGVASSYTYWASLDTLRNLLASGFPVLVIATHGLGAYDQQPVTFVPTEGDGSLVTVIRYQHSYVLIGYDAGGFWAIDPWSGSVDYFDATRFEADWALLGRQALWVTAW